MTSSPPAAPPAATGSPPRGNQRPAIFTCPEWESSAGPEAADLAAAGGLILDDWQAWYLTQALGERTGDQKWASFACGLICSRQNGKDAILEARQLAGLFLFGETLIVHTAHQFKTAQESYLRILALIEGHPDFDQQVARTPASHGEEGVELKPVPAIISGSTGKQVTRSRRARLRFICRSKSSARGFSGDLVIFNEAMILDTESVAAGLPVTMTRMDKTPGGPQVWYTGSAGMGKLSPQLARVRARGHRGGTSLCFAEWCIDPHDDTCPPGCQAHDDPYSVRSYCKANPGYGLPGRIDGEMVERARDEMDDAAFAREILGVGTYPAPESGWQVISRDWWTATMAPDDQRAARPVFAIDTTRDRAWTSVAACGLPGGSDRPRLELCEHRGGSRWAVPYAKSLDERRGPGTWVVDRRAAAGTLIAALEEQGLKVVCPTAVDIAHACGRFYDAIRDGALDHAPDREVQAGLAGLAVRRAGQGFAWDPDASLVDISGVNAYTLAHWGWETFGGSSDYDTGESVGFGRRQILALFTSGTYGPAQMARLRGRGLLDDGMLAELAAAGVHVPPSIT